MTEEADHSLLLIAGEFEQAADGGTLPNVNPTTRGLTGMVADAGPADVDRAVESARAAQLGWGRRDPSERGTILLRLAELLESHVDEVARLEAVDAGKPVLDTREDVATAARFIRFFAGLADKSGGRTIPVQPDRTAMTLREPYGVIGAIVPWNYPIFNASVKIAPILAMGNTCVLKPSELAPRSALLLGQLALTAGAPPGVLNVLTGGSRTGAALAGHTDIDKIAFTGSTATGRRVMEAAAQSNLKPCSLELGGKSPCIVFEDADIADAAAAISFSVFFNAGQTCFATTRVLVHEALADSLVDRLARAATRLVVGDPLDEATHLGPVISAAQYERVRGFIETGAHEGTIVAGEIPPASPQAGFFVHPTVLTNLAHDGAVALEEIFGPVVSVFTFNDEEEAVALANEVSYGLAASIWTRDVGRMHRIAGRVQAGIVWGNCVFGEHPAVPIGGYKQSGFGREFGVEAALEYTREKSFWVAHGGGHPGWPA